MPDLTWTKDFLDSCARRGIRPKTAESYAMILHILTNHYAIDFQNATEGEILQGLDKVRAENELSTYGAYVGFAKRALTFLNRKDVAERIEAATSPITSRSAAYCTGEPLRVYYPAGHWHAATWTKCPL